MNTVSIDSDPLPPENLTVEATARNADGQEASATCTTNFTVVAVDVSLGNWGELMDEKNNTIIGTYVKRDGTGWFDGYPDLAEEAMTQCPVEIEVLPKNLPIDERVALVFEDENLIVNEQPEVAKNSYGVREIKNRKFYLFNEKGAPLIKRVKTTHEDSSAEDVVKYDACCCTFTVYADVSDLFIEGAWYEKVMYFFKSVLDDMGHSFCKIDIDAGHQHLMPEHLMKYIGKPYGFYPNSDSHNGKTDAFYNVASAFIEEGDHFDNVDARKSGTVSHVWHISFDGCKEGLKRMYEIEMSKPKYDLMCFNCTDAAISIGRACGAPVPDAGIPDLSVLESIYGGAKGNIDWAQKVWNLWMDADGSYSSPLGLLVNLKYKNMMYGEKE